MADSLSAALLNWKRFAPPAKEAYPVNSGTSICGRLGGEDLALGFLGFSRLMMSQYVVGRSLEARPSRGFERRMAVEASVVAKNEFVEISLSMLAAEAVICAHAHRFQQPESPSSLPTEGRRNRTWRRPRGDRGDSRPSLDPMAWPWVRSVVPGFTLALTNA